MISTEEHMKLDKELFIECVGYLERDDKPDGAYIQNYGRFFNINKIKRLIEMGADVNFKDAHGQSPLLLAVSWSNKALVEILISAGADVNTVDRCGDSPLEVAVYRDNVPIAKLLISAGADVNAKNYKKCRGTRERYLGEPLLFLAKSKKMQDILKQHGATF